MAVSSVTFLDRGHNFIKYLSDMFHNCLGCNMRGTCQIVPPKYRKSRQLVKYLQKIEKKYLKMFRGE